MENKTLRLMISCNLWSLWYEPDPTEEGIAWHGEEPWRFNDLRSTMGLNFETVTGFAAQKALLDGSADISINPYGVNQMYAEKFDFSYPTYFVGVYILSARGNDVIKGNVFKGVFDDLTYGMASLSLVAMVLLTWFMIKNNKSIGFTTLHVIGNLVRQSLPDSMMPRSSMARTAWMLLVSVYNMVLGMMYCSIIISLLAVAKESNVINTLADLNKTENENVRLFVNDRSFVPGFLRSANMLAGFENRTDLIIGTKNSSLVIDSILNGSHVLIGPVSTLLRSF